jgi:hypothetical protein
MHPSVEGDSVFFENQVSSIHKDSGVERRGSDRFPTEREVRYRILNKRNTIEEGTGKTINISSNGVLFTTDQILIPGKRLELSISWPAQLDNKCQLKLVARGRVARLEQGRAAIEIQQYEFRTQGSRAFGV